MEKRDVLLRTITLLLASALVFYGCGGSSSSGSSGYVITGELDTTFGNGGIAVHDNAAGGTAGDDYGYSIALDNKGNIYVTGSSWNGSNGDMVIWKYTSTGILDKNFGNDGIAANDGAAGGIAGGDRGYSIALDNSGNIYVTGYSNNGADNDMVIWKYASDGSRDTTFGNDGIIADNNAAGGTAGVDIGYSIALDNNANIYVTGYSHNGADYDMVIWKYTPEGILDTTFDSDGIVVHDNAAGGTAGDDYGYSIVLDNNGNIYVTGYSSNGSNDDMVIWKYTSDGSRDTTFGTDGYVIHHSAAGGAGTDKGYSIALDNSDNIYVAGSSFNGSNGDMVIWKYTSTGILDISFNGDGIAVHDNAAGGSFNDYGDSIALDNSGNIYVAGNSFNGFSSDMVIWRYTHTGILDTTFNDPDGFVVHDGAAGGWGYDYGRSIILDNNNLYVAGNSHNSNGDNDMVIWNYK